MSSGFSFRVEAWAGWLAGSDGLQTGGVAAVRGTLPLSLRRRVSAIGRRALEAAWAVLPDSRKPRIILASRYGEYGRTFDLLNELDGSGEVSPADFSLAVHHALAGLLSIASGNKAGHSAIAAGIDSAGFALLEAAACLGESAEPVLVMCFDEPLPDAYAPIQPDHEDACVLALLLVPATAGQGELINTRMTPVTQCAGTPARTGALAATLMALLAGDDREISTAGSRMSWSWHRAEQA